MSMSLPRLLKLVSVAHRSVCCRSALPLSGYYNISRPHYNPPHFKSITSARNFSNTTMASVVTYEDVVTYKDKPEVLLVDVREPDEIKETGIIPGSINIPLGELPNVLQVGDNNEFHKRFKRNLPNKDAEIVFSCKMGGRAAKAMEVAQKIGFTNTKVYKGSWNDWESKRQA